MLNYILLFLSGIGGILLYSLVKISGINDRTPDSVSIGSIIGTYLRKDFPRIFVSIISTTIFLFGICKWLSIKESGGSLDIPGVSGNTEEIILVFIHLFVATIGYVSGSVVMAFGAKAEKIIQEKADDLGKDKTSGTAQ